MTAVTEKSKMVVVATTEKNPADDEVSQIWLEVQNMVIRMAGGDPSKIDKQLDIDGVMRYLEQTQAADQKAADKHGIVKKAFNRTLNCISKVGGIIADGASYAFAPANICFNALTFVIGAWQSYSAVFESLAELLEKCAQFLERLPYYDRMDASLRKVACCQLKLFIDVCDRTLQLKPKRRKIEMFFCQLFLDDDFIKDLLGQMENLTAREHRLVSAQSLKAGQDAAKASKESVTKLDTLIESSVAQKQDKLDQHFKSKVQEVFFGKNAKDFDTWDAALRRNKSLLINGTGEWLDEDALFTSWMMGSSEASPILGIEGGEGSGKTLLATHIISQLQKHRLSNNSKTRSAIAYYFLEEDSKDNSKTTFKKKRVAEVVSKSLLWQLAQMELPYLKSIAGICDKVNTEDPSDIWNQLLLENEDRSGIESTFFIVMDGLGDNIDGLAGLLQRISADAPRLRMRVIITGNQHTFDMLEEAGDMRITRMKLGMRNSIDIELYIIARMDAMENLKDVSRAGVAEIRTMILGRLTFATSGDYYITNSILSAIEGVDSLSEIEQCLDQVGSARPKQILADIKKLNLTLKPAEIDEVNEIILWTKWAIRWMSPLQLEAAIRLNTDLELSSQVSLRSLESKIREKYSLLFQIDENRNIHFSAEEMREIIPMKSYRSNNTDHGSDEQISPAEIKIVKHYLSTVCPADVYDKFGFEDFFAQKLERKTKYICQDDDNANIILSIRCMRSILDEEVNKTPGAIKFLSYAIEYLFWHLDNTDLSRADRDLKAQAGELLARVFAEESAIKALISRDYGPENDAAYVIDIDFMPFNWKSWVFNNNGADLINKWSNDSMVMSKLREQQDSPMSLANFHGINGPSWYETAAKITVKEFLNDKNYGNAMADAFSLLFGLIKRLEQHELHPAATTWDEIDDEEVWRPTMATVEVVETWAKKQLNIEEDDAHWEAQMARLLWYLERPENGITKEDCEKRARRAVELSPDDWFASYNLTRSLEDDRDAEAIAILEPIVEKLSKGAYGTLDEQEDESFGSVLESLGHRYWFLPNKSGTKKAFDLYIQSLDHSQAGGWTYHNIIAEKLGRHREWSFIIKYLEKLHSFDVAGMNLASRVLYEGTIDKTREFWYAIWNACYHTNRWDLLAEIWRGINKKSSDQERDPYWIYCTNMWYAIGLIRRPGHEDEGMMMLEGIFRENSMNEQVSFLQFDLASNLLVTYNNRAFAESASADTRNIYVTKTESLLKGFDDSCAIPDHCLLQLARFFTQNEERDRARHFAASFTAQRLEMLSDEDVSNDYDSFRDLALLFIAFNDEASIVACWEMMAVSRLAEQEEYERKMEEWRKQEERQCRLEDAAAAERDASKKTEAQTTDQRIESPEEETPKEQSPKHSTEETAGEGEVKETDEGTAKGPLEELKEAETKPWLDLPEPPENSIFICSEQCGFKTNIPTGIWLCTTCIIGPGLCNSCYVDIETKGVKDITCGKDHKFFQMPPCSKASIEEIPVGHIRVGGELVALEAWKEIVSAKYGPSVGEVVGTDEKKEG
ncbi:hypothetical protein CSAL01_01283 [Colletotrichum salicis]|uniref:Uncharacterized protein n=1 Tax=Colletotrichum salicis TaxID=1209931 RepID=A0A135TYX4_9PEZI|nr:hypothetical protein CSAL01_01283 [Colletotrichum salicis]